MNDYWLFIMAAALLLMNLSAFLLYRHDKIAARKGEWRVSENGLLLAALLGPFGAFAGMRQYRHKTRHVKFLLVPLFMVLWVIALGYLLYAWLVA
jgi:uncharacterized membrane protein YsdA (DUF1294 family)